MRRRGRYTNLVAVDFSPTGIWTLSADRQRVRLTIPPVRLARGVTPLELFLDFDAGAVEEIVEHLTALRDQMAPPLEEAPRTVAADGIDPAAAGSTP